QAEDGIRDFHVTGVQTCALPICTEAPRPAPSRSFKTPAPRPAHRGPMADIAERYDRLAADFAATIAAVPDDRWGAPSPCEGWTEIGRASCRERVEISDVGGAEQR